MDPDRWAHVKALFHEALDREPVARAAFLDEACGGDPSLRATVAGMLARHGQTCAVLDAPALEVEAAALARDLASTDRPGRRLPSATTWWTFLVGAVFLLDFLLSTWSHLLGPERFGYSTILEDGRYAVAAVRPGSAAGRAGMAPGDVIVAFEGLPFERATNTRAIVANLQIGRAYVFGVERDGRPVAVSVRPRRQDVVVDRDFGARALWQAGSALMVGLGFLIALKRPRDGVARMGALTLATLSAGLWLFNFPPGYAALWRSLPWGLGALLWIPKVCVSVIGAIGLTFFVRFPRPLFRSRWPWALIWLPALWFAPGDIHATWLTVYTPMEAYGSAPWNLEAGVARFGAYGLAMLVAIATNYLRLDDPGERRRLRVLVIGGAAATSPAVLRMVLIGVAPDSAMRAFLMSGWPDILIAGVFLLFPVSFAYAVLRHHVLDVRLIVRMGIQYALARGTVATVVPLLLIALALDALVHGNDPLLEILRTRGWVYLALAGLAALAGTQRTRWRHAIDRRFFREQYDTGRLLRDVAEEARRAGSLEGAAPAIAGRIEAALHPEFAALMLRLDGLSFQCVASAPSGQAPPPIREDSRVVAMLRESEESLNLTVLEPSLPPDEVEPLRDAGVELLVPIVMNVERHEAFLALGPRRSEEPYARADVNTLAAVASSLSLLAERPTPLPERLASAFEECPRCGTCYDSGAGACAHERTPLKPVEMPRTLAGRYRLEQRLGQGGMASVYKATDAALARLVAVKVIRDEWVSSPAAVQRFRREARAVAGLDHPNIVTVHDYGVEAGSRAFLVMELLDGGTLREALREAKRLPPSRALDVFHGVCKGVDAAHRHHLVHRDLKPENIYLARPPRAGQPGVKILDFGVAKPLPGWDEPANDAHETEFGVLVGTVGYMSPEQLQGERPAISWDLWALAVVAYESLFGVLPFPVAPRDRWRRAVLAGRYTPLEAHLKTPPAGWQAFFESVFSVDRTRRPASALDFLQKFERALD